MEWLYKRLFEELQLNIQQNKLKEAPHIKTTILKQHKAR